MTRPRCAEAAADPRCCIGAAFAQFEMDVVIRTMLRHFELMPTDAHGERERFRGVAFAPRDGGVAVVRRRREPLGRAARDDAAAAACPIDHAADQAAAPAVVGLGAARGT